LCGETWACCSPCVLHFLDGSFFLNNLSLRLYPALACGWQRVDKGSSDKPGNGGALFTTRRRDVPVKQELFA
jgi:hypothetical protein